MKLAQKILVVLMILSVMPVQADMEVHKVHMQAPSKNKFDKFDKRDLAVCKDTAKKIKAMAASECEDGDGDGIACGALESIKNHDYTEKNCIGIMSAYEHLMHK